METGTIREAVGVFDDPEQLESAVSELQSNGIDRADLSFFGTRINDGHAWGCAAPWR